MTVTQDQQIALDFFAVWEQQVKYFGLTILPEREDRLLFRKGKKLMEAAIALKGKNSTRVPYTKAEVICIVNAYIKNDNRQSVKDTFFKAFPNSQHTEDSVLFQACLLENLDNTKTGQSGSYHITELVAEVASEIAPERFAAWLSDSNGGVLDSLPHIC